MIARAFGREGVAIDAPDAVVPILSLDSDSYKHPTYGKTYFPVFEIVRWVGLDGTEQSVDEIKAAEEAAAAAEPKAETAKTRTVPATKTAEKSKAELLREQLAAAEAEEAGGGEEAAEQPAEAAEPQRLRRRRNA